MVVIGTLAGSLLGPSEPVLISCLSLKSDSSAASRMILSRVSANRICSSLEKCVCWILEGRDQNHSASARKARYEAVVDCVLRNRREKAAARLDVWWGSMQDERSLKEDLGLRE